MKKRITDWLDDLPEEFLEEISEREQKRKNYKNPVFGNRKRIAFIAAVIVLLAGTIGAAAVYSPDLFRIYFRNGEAKLRDGLELSESKTIENRDYRLQVENVMSDGRFISILISVEALNETSRKTLNEGKTVPVVQMSQTDSYHIQEWQTERTENKRYYLWEGTVDQDDSQEKNMTAEARIFYIEGIERYYDFEEWIYQQIEKTGKNSQQISEEEFDRRWNRILDSVELQLTVSTQEKVENVITILPDQKIESDGILIEELKIYPSGIIWKGTIPADKNEEELEEQNPIIYATMKNNKRYCIMKPEGYEIEENTEQRLARTKTTRVETEDGGNEKRIRRNASFSYIFPIDKIQSIEVEGVEYPVKR